MSSPFTVMGQNHNLPIAVHLDLLILVSNIGQFLTGNYFKFCKKINLSMKLGDLTQV